MSKYVETRKFIECQVCHQEFPASLPELGWCDGCLVGFKSPRELAYVFLGLHVQHRVAIRKALVSSMLINIGLAITNLSLLVPVLMRWFYE
jgi:hypothetical protein